MSELLHALQCSDPHHLTRPAGRASGREQCTISVLLSLHKSEPLTGQSGRGRCPAPGQWRRCSRPGHPPGGAACHSRTPCCTASCSAQGLSPGPACSPLSPPQSAPVRHSLPSEMRKGLALLSDALLSEHLAMLVSGLSVRQIRFSIQDSQGNIFCAPPAHNTLWELWSAQRLQWHFMSTGVWKQGPRVPLRHAPACAGRSRGCGRSPSCPAPAQWRR